MKNELLSSKTFRIILIAITILVSGILTSQQAAIGQDASSTITEQVHSVLVDLMNDPDIKKELENDKAKKDTADEKHTSKDEPDQRNSEKDSNDKSEEKSKNGDTTDAKDDDSSNSENENPEEPANNDEVAYEEDYVEPIDEDEWFIVEEDQFPEENNGNYDEEAYVVEEYVRPTVYDFGYAKQEYGSLTAHNDGSINEFQPGYFALHGNDTLDFTDIEPGDTIIINGISYYIDGYINFYSGEDYESVRNRIGWDRALFSSCYESETGTYSRLLYSSPCGDFTTYKASPDLWYDYDAE